MLVNLGQVLQLLTPKERRRGLLVLLMVLVMGLLEAMSVASIMPFLAVLGDPELVSEHSLLSAAYDWFGFASVESFLFALGIGSFAMVVLGAVFRSLTKYAVHRFAEMRRHAISSRLLETYLRQPYEFFLDRHTGDLAKGILSEVDQLVQKVFRPGLEAAVYLIVASAISALLIAVDPGLALVVSGVVVGAYGVLYLAVRGFIGRIGRDRITANRERFTAAGEALSGIKDVKLLGRERAYVTRFYGPSLRFARHQATTRVVAEVPKYLIEGIAFGGVVALALFLMTTSDGVGDALPILGLYAFAGYRLLPAAQRIYASFTKLRFGLPVVHDIYDDLKTRERLVEIRKPIAPEAVVVPREEISLRDVSFRYRGAPEPAVEELNIDIPVGSTIGIVGGTGAGKTTLVDLLLGLLAPTMGRVEVDGVPITDENVRRWQAAIGYVPQDIFLTDATVAENIALGIPPEDVDRCAVEHAARMAQAHEFITEELSRGYDTAVGERGGRLSGGQRQRLGIARALYHDPPLLVFDEATSSLDPATERAVMESVGALQGKKTVVMIAHRLSTVQACERVYLMSGGRIRASGSYRELLEHEPEMRRLAGVS